MANISSAEGKMTLEGNWTKEAVEAFSPVLDSWEFYGAYGIQWHSGLSIKKKSIQFSGCGRWGFSGTLESFDDWTRDWIQNHPEDTSHPLTQEQYDAFLQIAHDNDLRILVEYEDDVEGFDGTVREKGEFTSDGESLCFELLSSEDVRLTWKEMGKEAFDAAVDCFMSLLDGADEKQVRRWVQKQVVPSYAYYNYGNLEDVMYDEAPISEETMQNFIDTFHPDTEEWESFYQFCKEEMGYFQPPFWKIHSEDELEVELEKGTVSYSAQGAFSYSVQFTYIKDHEELREKYHWRDTFPNNVDYWRDVKQIAVGRDNVVWLKKNGALMIGSHWGFYNDDFWANNVAVAVAAGWEHVLILRENGTVETKEYFSGDHDTSSWTDITAVACGAYHSVGLKKDGTVVATGNNQYGQCNVEDWKNITAIAAGGAITMGLKKDGTVLLLPEGDPNLDVRGWRDIVAIDAGEMYAVGLKKDGTVVACGNLFDAQKECLSWKGIQAIAAGGWHILGLKEDGTVVACGGSNMGQCTVEDWSNIVSIAAGHALSFGIHPDGTVVSVGDYFDPNAPEEEDIVDDMDNDLDDDEEDWEEDWEEDLASKYPTDELEQLDFKGKTFVLTGQFQNSPEDREEIKILIENKGGICRTGISGKTNYLVLGDFGDIGESKVEKALEQKEKGKDIKIITESTLFKFLS